jgi:glycosyltransferase involved in cell wall biosynthesis
LRILVASPQVPFARGGAEILAETLVAELRRRDHAADLVTIPFKWYPGARVLSQAFLWRLVDLEEANEQPVDLVIGTKFPSYAVRHPRKVVWLVHQLRQAYELDRTELGQFSDSAADRALRRRVHRFDRVALGEARHVFTISQNVADRVERNLGIPAESLPPPPQPLDFRCESYGDFVLSVNRLDRAKRIDLLIEAAAAEPGLNVVIAGDGPDRARLERLAADRKLNGRIRFDGRVSEQELAGLYATCRAVFYAPVDEDYGMVPYEAFLSGKPVVTTLDAGGPLEDGSDRPGRVVPPDAREIGGALAALDPGTARRLGEAGRELAARVTWDHCIDRLLAYA